MSPGPLEVGNKAEKRAALMKAGGSGLRSRVDDVCGSVGFDLSFYFTIRICLIAVLVSNYLLIFSNINRSQFFTIIW